MNRIPQLWRRFIFYLQRSRFDRELAEEFRFHLEMRIEENVEQGMSHAQARHAATRRFGSDFSARERSRDIWLFGNLEVFMQDLRYAIRLMLKQPGFTLVAIFTLALGIGANTAIFSVVNGVLLRSLPFANAEQLVSANENDAHRGQLGFSFPRFTHIHDNGRFFDGFAAYASTNVNLANSAGGAEPERLNGMRVSDGFFRVLGVTPILGRTFSYEEDQPGGNPVVMISYSLWQRRFGGDPGLVGKSITVDSQSCIVIGIVQADLRALGQATDVWLPRPMDGSTFSLESIKRGATLFAAVGRLKPDVSLAQAQTEVNVLTSQYQQSYPGNTDNPYNTVLVPLREQLVGNIRPMLLVLLAAVGCVLLIACGNLANLLLARATGRQREIAIRTALGATRWRLIVQVLTESVLLAILGGAVGLGLAYIGVKFLIATGPRNLPRLDQIQLDGKVLVFTLLVTLLSGILFGLAPALLTTKANLNESLKEGGRSGSEGGQRNRLRGALVVSEFALALVLLIGAGLLIRSFIHLQSVKLGLDPQGLLTMQIGLPTVRYSDAERQSRFFNQLLQRVESLPGVASVGLVSRLPLGESPVGYIFNVEGTPDLGPKNPITLLRIVNPGYMRTMSIPLVRGRLLDEHDLATAPRVVVVNESFARHFLPNQDPIGKRLIYSNKRVAVEIVGIVADVKDQVLDTNANEEMYAPYQQVPWPSMSLIVKTGTSDPLSLTEAVRQQVLAVDKDQPVANIKTMEQTIGESVAQPRLTMLLLGLFAAVALALAAIGSYGVMSYSVARRINEIGIRMALGAQRGDVMKMVVGQGMKLALIGAAVGLVAALMLTRLMAKLLYGVSATDLTTFAAVPSILLLVALIACYIPARHAVRVDPVIALRHE